MKYFISILILLISFSSLAAENLSTNMMPLRYIKRTEPVLNIALVYYGDHYSIADLDRIQVMLEDRFYKATGNALKLNTVKKALIPFQNKIEDFPEYTQPYVTDIDRLQRLWYYDNVGAKILKNVWELAKFKGKFDLDLKDVDAMLIVTGAQFDALGFASGRVGVTENPMEIAWGLPNGGKVEYVTDARVVDELIHEIGHTMFLDHASGQCQNPKLSYSEQQACCETSQSKNDVMSYCRKRNLVNDEFFYGFASCMQKIIKNKVVPALLKGGEWRLQNREKCL